MSDINDPSRRPLTARSVIASTLLGVDPPRLPALALVRSGELFGLREGTTRTALSRMAAAGEVLADDAHYVLAGHLLDRHARQQQARATSPFLRSGDEAVDDWDGTWVLALVNPERRSAAARTSFRAAAHTLKLAELREGVWARPDDLDGRTTPSRVTVDAQVTWARGVRPDDVAVFVDAFDLPAWARTAHALIAEMQDAQPALDARSVDALADTFVVSAAVLRHLVADPSLPRALLPPGWPGDDLRQVYDRFESAFKATWTGWYRNFREN